MSNYLKDHRPPVSAGGCERHSHKAAGAFLGMALVMAVFAAALLTVPSQSFAAVVGPIATKAICGPGDRPESGLQGQTSYAEQFAPGPKRAFTCNLRLLGQATGEGAAEGLAITDTCAYFSQWLHPEAPNLASHPGVVVVDVRNPRDPRIVRYLQTPAMRDSAASLLVSQARKLLVAQSYGEGLSVKTTDIYDISNCLAPVLKYSGVIPGFKFHTGDFSPDGRIVWAASGEDRADTITALDVSDPSHPKVVAQWKSTDPRISRFHNVTVSDDGRTAYFGIGRQYPKEKMTGNHQGMGILDVSEVQEGRPNPRITMIGRPLFWPEADNTGYTRPFTSRGHKYVWQSHLRGAIPSYGIHPTGRVLTGAMASRAYDGPAISPEDGCRSGRPAWGYVDILNVDNPAVPVQVSGIRLEVHDPKNCVAIARDPAYSYAYSSMYCEMDDYQDPQMMACGFSLSGLRVFDIRDVMHPREIAYYKPPATGSAPRPGSMYNTFREHTWPKNFHGADGVIWAMFAKGGKEIWFESFDNGFQVVRFTDEFMAREKELFSRDITCNGRLRDRHGCAAGE